MQANYIEIGNRKVGEDFPPLIIAEIGINHEGSIDTAFAMVDAAHSAGAEVVKHQTHILEDEMSGAAKAVIPGNTDASIYEVMRRCALNEDEELALKKYIESKGMIFLSTPFSRAAANRLEKFEVCAYKIGSGECNNYPLIRHIARFGKPMIVSTGMNDLESIAKTVHILEDSKTPYALLHTTNLYPTPDHLVRLGAMQEMQRRFPNAVIGLSDHTVANYACFAAVAMGASVLERHFTDSMDRQGPDIVNSMDPIALEQLIEGSESIYRMRGGVKRAVPEEKVTSDFAFSSVVTIARVVPGEIFTEKNIWVKRPGTGEVSAESYEKILGKACVNTIEVDTLLSWADIGE